MRRDDAALGTPEHRRFDQTGSSTGPDSPVTGWQPGCTSPSHRDCLGRNPAGLQHRPEPLHPVGAGGTEVARPGDAAGNTHFRAGAGRQAGGRGPGPRAGSGTGPKGRRRVNSGRLRLRPQALAAAPTKAKYSAEETQKAGGNTQPEQHQTDRPAAPCRKAFRRQFAGRRRNRVEGTRKLRNAEQPPVQKARRLLNTERRDKEAYVPSTITALVHDPVAVWQQFCTEVGIQHNGRMSRPPRV